MPWRHLEHPADVRLEIAAESPEALVGECSLAFYDVALGEEAPEAYKNVDRVVDVVERAGLCRKVARLRPLGVIKG
jgi:RNA-splicing ligase RtcB